MSLSALLRSIKQSVQCHLQEGTTKSQSRRNIVPVVPRISIRKPAAWKWTWPDHGGINTRLSATDFRHHTPEHRPIRATIAMSIINPERSQDRAALLDFYQLKTLTPKDYKQDSIDTGFHIDLSTDDLSQIPKEVVNHLLGDNSNAEGSKGERPSSLRRHTANGSKTLYADALGFHKNILDELIDRDILDDTRDPQLNKFMVDSKLFNPKLFLSVIHSDKSLNELIMGIKNLEKDINSKKPLLQQLITNNFEKTLSSRNSLDKVYNEFSSSNLESVISALNDNVASSNNSANQLLNPVLMLMSKEQELSSALEFIKENKFFLDLPKKLKSLIDVDDFDSVMKEYQRGFAYFQKLKAMKNNNPLYDRIWQTVLKAISDYKTSMVSDLKKIHIELISNNFRNQINTKKDNFVLLIKRIAELSPNENPIKEFIQYQYNYILNDLDKGLAKINYNRLFNAKNAIINAYSNVNSDPDSVSNNLINSTTAHLFASFGSSAFSENQIDALYEKLDSPVIVHWWSLISNYVYDVTQEVVAKKILKFETIVEFFMNDFNKLLSADVQRASKFTMDDQTLLEMKSYFDKLIKRICSRLEFVFTCTSDDLVNALKLGEREGTQAVFPQVGEKDLNVPSTFGYVPMNSNLVSTAYYTVQLHDAVFKTLINIKNKDTILNGEEVSSTIDHSLALINKNMIYACLSVLNDDIKRIVSYDRMVPNEEVSGATTLITFVANYYKMLISKLHQLYICDDTDLLKTIENEFLKSLDSLVEGMVTSIQRQTKRDPSQVDYYYLSTVYNMRNLSSKTIPNLLKSFDINFHTELSKVKRDNVAVYVKLDKYEYGLFVDYMKEPVSVLKRIINDGMSQVNKKAEGLYERLAAGETIEISNYILQCINDVNTLESKLKNMNVRESFITDVKASLVAQFQKKIMNNLSNEYTKEALYQLVLDIDVILILFHRYNEKASGHTKLDTLKLEEVYKKLTESVDMASVEKNRGANLTYNHAQFICFTTL